MTIAVTVGNGIIVSSTSPHFPLASPYATDLAEISEKVVHAAGPEVLQGHRRERRPETLRGGWGVNFEWTLGV